MAGDQSFEQFIKKSLVLPIAATQRKIRKEYRQTGSEAEQRFWQGTRQEVEVPPNLSQGAADRTLRPKSIAPELLNHRFLRFDSYHHYADWEEKMRATYDQFNLLEIPANDKDSPALYFNPKTFNRRVPRGIFPDARSPRVVLRPPGSEFEVDKWAQSSTDEMSRFERSPMQTMVKKELQKNAELAHLEPNLEMQKICNLQNIKHSLKSDISDGKICEFLFNQLSFTDKLIDEHLLESSADGKQVREATFVERDAESYRDFLNRQMSSEGDVVAPYDHFWMRENVKRGNPEEIAQKIMDLENEHLARGTEEYEAKR